MDLEKVLETIKNEYPTLKFETEKLGILSVIIVKGKKKKQEIRLYYSEQDTTEETLYNLRCYILEEGQKFYE